MGGIPESIEAAVLVDLEQWGPKVAGTGLAALALAAARDLDRGMTPTPAAQTHAQLRETLLKLAELADAQEEPAADEIDELLRKRNDRRRGA